MPRSFSQHLDGAKAIMGMILLDEIRGRLAEVFSLKTYKIDHVVHGAIASAAVYGAMMGATPEQIEYAIGMLVAHYIPFRAIRAGHQLSDSKGASAAISTEVCRPFLRCSERSDSDPIRVWRRQSRPPFCACIAPCVASLARATSSATPRPSSASSSLRPVRCGVPLSPRSAHCADSRLRAQATRPSIWC